MVGILPTSDTNENPQTALAVDNVFKTEYSLYDEAFDLLNL